MNTQDDKELGEFLRANRLTVPPASQEQEERILDATVRARRTGWLRPGHVAGVVLATAAAAAALALLTMREEPAQEDVQLAAVQILEESWSGTLPDDDWAADLEP